MPKIMGGKKRGTSVRSTRRIGGPLLVSGIWTEEPDQNRAVRRSPWGHPLGRARSERATPVEKILGAKAGEHPWGGGEDERRPDRGDPDDHTA
jgi:hypothetical protein